MIKTVLISTGLVGLTAFGGMALSMAHEMSFAEAERVQGDQLVQVAMVQPAPGSVEGQAVVSGTLQAAPSDAEVIPAILESTGPYNRLAGKSIATASANAPATAIRPMSREFGDNNLRAPADAVLTVSVPDFSQSREFTYAAVVPSQVAPQRPIAAAVSAPAPSAPTPSFLVGVYR